MTGSVPDSNPQENRRSCMIRVTSPNENVIMDVSKVMRSQEFRGGNNSPKYTLFASDSREMSFWGAQNTFLAWYRNLEDIRREIREIQKALDTGSVSYTLQYSLYRSSDRKGDTVASKVFWSHCLMGLPHTPFDTDFICGYAMFHRYFSSRWRSVICCFRSSSPSRYAAFALWIRSSRICSCVLW